jgi:hypothetical protein
MTADELVLGLILYGLLPLWAIAGFVDYLCHRASDIEHTSGARESVVHIVLGFQVGVPVLLALLFEINVLVTLICFALLVAHALVAHYDVVYASPRRHISVWEVHAHCYLLTIPFFTFALVAVLNWDAFQSTIGLRWTGELSLVLRSKPIGPARYVFYYFGVVFLLGLLPYTEELRRCLKAQRAEAARRDAS